MSLNRENAVWQSGNGTWNIGMFSYTQTGDDYEWDVTYDYSSFWWASKGHTSAENAIDAYCAANANAGSYYVMNREGDNVQHCDQLDKMLDTYYAENTGSGAVSRVGFGATVTSGRGGYTGRRQPMGFSPGW